MGKKKGKKENEKKFYLSSEFQDYTIVNEDEYTGPGLIRIGSFRDMAIETVRNGMRVYETEIWVEERKAYGISKTIKLDNKRNAANVTRRYVRIPNSTDVIIAQVSTAAIQSLYEKTEIRTKCKIERLRNGKKKTLFFTEGAYNGDEVPDIFYKCLEFNTEGMKKIEFDDLEESEEKIGS